MKLPGSGATAHSSTSWLVAANRILIVPQLWPYDRLFCQTIDVSSVLRFDLLSSSRILCWISRASCRCLGGERSTQRPFSMECLGFQPWLWLTILKPFIYSCRAYTPYQ